MFQMSYKCRDSRQVLIAIIGYIRKRSIISYVCISIEAPRTIGYHDNVVDTVPVRHVAVDIWYSAMCPDTELGEDAPLANESAILIANPAKKADAQIQL